MGYTNFLIWAGKQGFKYGQKYLYKAWKEAEKLGKPIAEKHFPKLINKAEDLYKNFKGFDPKVVPKEIVKPKRFKWDDAGPGSAFDKRLRAILDKHKAKIKPENLNAANTSRFVTGAKEGITSIKPPGFNPSVIKGGKKGWKPKKAEGGRIGLDEGGPSQKEIDKGIAAIEKLKSSLMPESYEELIEIYKDKQKDLNIDIMESAGGLGEMLGEGGVAGHSPLALEQLPSQRRKKHIPHKFPKLGEGGRIGMMYGGDPGFAFSYGGSWADWKENHASEMPVMDYINQKLPKARNPFSNGGEVPLSWEEIFTKHMQGQPLTDEERKILGQVPTEDKAEGGRIGFADGDEVFDPLEGAFDDILEEIKKQRRKRKAEELKDIKNWDPQNPTYHASGGRIGMASGDSVSTKFLKNWYWDGKGPTGSTDGAFADRLSELEFLLKHGQEIWDRHGNAKGGRVGFKKGGKGGIGDLMSEMYRLFEIAPLLATPELMDLIQKVPFEKGGRAEFKKGGGPNMSRRSFLQLMGGLASLPVVGKYFKLAKPATDFGVKLKTKFHNSDVDYGTSGFAYFDLSSLTGPVKLAASNIIKKLKIKDLKNVEPGDTKLVLKELEKKGIKGKLTGIVDEGGDVLKQAEKAGQKNFVQTYKKQSMKQNVKDHKQYNDYVVYENDPGFRNWNAATKGKLDKPFVSTIDEVAEMLESVVKKAGGGSVGYPPVQWDPKEQPSVQGPSYETNNPNEAFKEILRRNIGSGITAAPLGGKFSLDVPYGEGSEIDFGVGFNTDPRSSGFGAGYGVNLDGNDTMGAEYRSPDDSFNIGVRKQEGSNPQWNFQKKWKFAKGGKAWQPKSAPQLTTTIPPESGPMPHGLTYLTGDDIVQNIGYKHGRN